MLKRIEKNKKQKVATNNKSKRGNEKDKNVLEESKEKKKKLAAVEEEIDSYIEIRNESNEGISEQMIESIELSKKEKKKKLA